MLRGTNIVLTVFNAAVLTVLLVAIWQGYWQPTVGPSGIEYKDFVSILLTALGLMLGVLAAVIAVAAIWGYEGIKKAAVAASVEAAIPAASEAALKTAVEYLSQSEPQVDYGAAAGLDKGQDGSQSGA